MRILGVDPGLSTAGIGLIESDGRGNATAIDWLAIETDPALPFADRLLELVTDLEGLLAEMKPEVAVIEKLFFATNKKTAMDVSQARGAIVVTLRKFGVRVLEATPLQLKMSITGDGQADKKQMQSMVQRILKLETLPTPADAADALGLALYGAYSLRGEGVISSR